MIAAIDSGNSSVKLGIFDQAKLIKSFNSILLPDLKKQLKNFPGSRIIISDVGGRRDKLLKILPGNSNPLLVSAYLKYPFKIKYKSPESLGSDRLAAVIGAWHKFGPAHLLIIDVGSCITFDVIDKKANYLGGGISPGISMRLQALHSFTSSLPEIAFIGRIAKQGNDTKSSILKGTVGGTIFEIEGLIKQFCKRYPGIKIVLCGGNARFIGSKLKGSVNIIPDLVLWGLMSISLYNDF